ncbi:MAG: hypothetical protein AB7F86_04960 [Bdellovibrionales bacterium]
MRILLRTTFSLASICYLLACASNPIKTDQLSEGQWKARALVKDKEQGRSYIVNLSFNAVRGQNLRMDVTNTLGTAVAALARDGQEVRYILFDSKRFYFGKSQPDVMRPILSIPLDPRWIESMLFDRAIEDKSWTCTKDGKNYVKDCLDAVTGLKVSWSNRVGGKKTVSIEHPKAFVQLNVTSFKPKVEDRKNLFVLEAPEGFQKLRIR